MNTSQEQLQTLEDDLEVPRQDLEDKKREEAQRRKKIANFRKEIQVRSALSFLFIFYLLPLRFSPSSFLLSKYILND